MNIKKILKITLMSIFVLILALVFLFNYNKNKLVANKSYTILTISNVGNTPAVIAECTEDDTVRCFKLKNSYNYNIKLPKDSLVSVGENILYNKYGNFVFHSEVVEIMEAKATDDSNASLDSNFDDLTSQIDGIEGQISELESQIVDVMTRLGL